MLCYFSYKTVVDIEASSVKGVNLYGILCQPMKCLKHLPNSQMGVKCVSTNWTCDTFETNLVIKVIIRFTCCLKNCLLG